MEIILSEILGYQLLSEKLKAEFSNIDEETLKDTLEGLSDLPDMIEEVIRSSLEDEMLTVGLKSRLEDLSARLERLKQRCEKKRQLACRAMTEACIGKIHVSDFTASLRTGPPRLEIEDEAKLPETYLIPQPPRLDRAGLLSALKQGSQIEGASLVPGRPHIAVRTT